MRNQNLTTVWLFLLLVQLGLTTIRIPGTSYELNNSSELLVDEYALTDEDVGQVVKGTFRMVKEKAVALSQAITLNPSGSTFNGSYREIEGRLFSCGHSDDYPTWSLVKHNVGITWGLIYEGGSNYLWSSVMIAFIQSDLGRTRDPQFTLRCNVSEKAKEIHVRVLALPRKMECKQHEDCLDKFSVYSTCLNVCRCIDTTTTSSAKICRAPPSSFSKLDPSTVFKATMIVLACFFAIVISFFALFCFQRNRLCMRLSHPHPFDDPSRIGSDLFSVSDQLARERLADKPPTYQDVVQSDRLHRGVPPPEYSSTSSEEPYQSQVVRTEHTTSDEHRCISRLAIALTRSRELYRDREGTVPTSTHRPEDSRTASSNNGSYSNPGFVTES